MELLGNTNSQGKLLYLAKVNFNDKYSFGVVKKIRGQINAFEALGFVVDLIYVKDNTIYLNDKVLKEFSSINDTLDRSLMIFRFYRLVSKNINLDEYGSFYFRFPSMTNAPLLKLLSKLKSKKKKILFEIATFPYEQELTGSIPKRIMLGIDRNYAGKLVDHLDYIITNYPHDMILNIPTIIMGNGINFEKFRNYKVEPDKTRLELISVSSLVFWHGLDRLLKGLKNYYDLNPTFEVHLNIVGEGAEKEKLIYLTKDLGLTNYVHFLGFKSGDELDRAFKSASIGIGTLGIHRKGISTDNSLKTREYIARGIPVILAADDIDIEKGTPFIHHVDPSEDNIDINGILKFYSQLQSDFPDFAVKAKEFAEEKLSWKAKISKVLKNFNN